MMNQTRGFPLEIGQIKTLVNYNYFLLDMIFAKIVVVDQKKLNSTYSQFPINYSMCKYQVLLRDTL